MTSLGLLVWILLGIALQLGLFLAIVFWHQWQAYNRLKGTVPRPIESMAALEPATTPAAGRAGFHPFRVSRRIREDAAGQVCSFYLEPEDRQPLAAYKPGQFLTFQLDIPGAEGGKPEHLTRCYSLSDAPAADHYRVSIKRVPAPAGSGHPPGRSSNYFHDRVQVGSILQVRSPGGHFLLEPGDESVVLIAAGIGITPLLSMLEWSQANQPGREIWLFYGARNSAEAAFASRLDAIAAANPKIRVRYCFSAPLPGDRPGKDYHFDGRVSVKLLRMELPLKPYQFYLCGPPSMLQELVSALEDWGVPETRIHFEAFGPAFIRRRQPAQASGEGGNGDAAGDIRVVFARSGKQALWSPQSASLLEFAEAQGIAIDSGCRAGACGTCQTAIRSGEVAYRQTPDQVPQPGTCLMCVSTPRTDLTLEA